MGSRYNEPTEQMNGSGPYRQLIKGPDGHTEREVDITIGYAVIDALLAVYPDVKDDKQQEKPDGPQKLQRFELAQRVRLSMTNDKDIDFTVSEQQTIDGLVVRKWATDVYGQVRERLYGSRNGTEPTSALG